MFKKRKLTKKVISLVSLIIFISYIFISVFTTKTSFAAQSTEVYSAWKISNYPGYQELIEKLQANHPNWCFKILYTGLDWNQAIKNETTACHGRNLVYIDKSGAWVCATCGDKPYDTGKWKCASEAAVAYYMDPRNWINEDYIFQFEDLSYDANTQNLDGVQKILLPVQWANVPNITYMKTDGTQGVIEKTYAQVIMEAAQEANISPYHLASRIALEQGKKSTPGATATGTYNETYRGLYNFCNINASGNTSETVIVNALTYARDKGWTDPEAAIKGGAKFIAKSYINVGQSTLYLEKFDVDNSDGKLYYHQYMANVSVGATESLPVRNSYASLGMLNNSFTFVIPVFENMPTEVCRSPESATIVTQNMEIKGTSVQIRNAPSLIGTVITKLNTGDRVLRIECAANQTNGYYWDKIVLANGSKGYVARNYISQIGDVTNCNISAVANTSVNLRNGPGTSGTSIVTTLISGQAVTIIEKDAYNGLNDFDWVRVKLASGSQGYIASKYLTEVGSTPADNGNKTEYTIATIKCEEGSAVRIRSEATTSSNIITTCPKGATVTIMQENVATANGYAWDKIVTSDGLEGYIANNYLNKANNNVDTTKPVEPQPNVPEVTYPTGDCNGDNVINSGDLLALKKYLLGTYTPANDAMKQSMDVNKDGVINSGDLLLIKKHLLGTYTIN